jgi:hypothetical protein
MEPQLETVFPASLAAFFFEAFDPAEFDVGAAAGIVGRETSGDILGDLLLNMEMQFGVEPFFDERFMTEPA